MEIQKETVSLFDQDKKYVTDYLKSRGLRNRELSKIIKNIPFGLLKDAYFKVDDEEYCISHFLSKSQIVGYDIKKVNDFLKTDTTSNVIFALVLGDDALCCDIDSKVVYLWKIQTGDGKKIKVSDNLTCFLKSINDVEETTK